jgi:hypothetical protein
MLANGVGEGGIFVANQLSCVGNIVVSATFLIHYLNLFDRAVPSASVRVAYKSSFEEPCEVGFLFRGLNTEGGISSRRVARHEVRESGERPSSAMSRWVGI